MTRRTAFGLYVALLLSQIAAAAQLGPDPPFALPETVRMLPDLVYRDVDEQHLRLDVFLPRREGTWPAVVFIHGSRWGRGTKSQFWRQAVYLAQRGFVGVTIEHRLSRRVDGAFPGPLDDAVASIGWLRAHATDLGVDPTRIGIAGGSSGGHLAALVGLNAWSGHDWSGASAESRVQAAVLFNPLLDLPPFGTPTTDNMRVVERNVRELLGGSQSDYPDRWRAASAMNHVGPAAAPFLFLHGTADATVPFGQSAEMRRRFVAAGVRAELFTAEGADHGFFDSSPWFERTVERMEEFLQDVLVP